MIAKAINDLKRAFALRHVWLYQAWHETQSKYKRTLLGPFWIAASMMATAGSLALVFGAIMGQDLHIFYPYILSGMMAFYLCTFPLQEGPELFTGAAGIIKNTSYPFSYYICERISKVLISFGHNLVVFYAVVLLIGAAAIPHWTILIGFPIVVTTMFFWAGAIATISSRFRDLRIFLPYTAQFMFSMTPIFWQADQIGQKRAFIAHVNPIYGLVEMIRSPLLGHAPPHICWGLALSAMISGMVVWTVTFIPFRRRIPFWV